MADEITSVQGSGQTGNFYQISLDIVEGVVAGGLIGMSADLIASAVATVPNAFITAPFVPVFSVIAGVLAFTGIAIHQIRKRV